MPEITSDVVVSAAKFFYAPYGTALPADSLAVGGSWPAGWVYVGYTTEPLESDYSFDTFEVEVEQALSPIREEREKELITLSTTLAEHSAANLAIVIAGKKTGTAPTTTVAGNEIVTVGGNAVIPTYTWGIEALWTNDAGVRSPIRMFIWKAQASKGSKWSYAKREVAGFPLTIVGKADTTKPIDEQLMKWIRILPPTG